MTAIVTFVTIGLGCCHKYGHDTRKFKIESKAKYPFSKVLWAALKINHPLLNCIVSVKYPNLAIPKFFNIVILWIYAFALTFLSVSIISNKNVSIGRVLVILAILFELALLFIRPIFNYIVYALYHNKTDTTRYIEE